MTRVPLPLAFVLAVGILGSGGCAADSTDTQSRLLQLPDGGIDAYGAAECHTAPGLACAQTGNACKASECLHDRRLCQAGKLLDLAHSFADQAPFRVRKAALEVARGLLEQALLGEQPDDPVGGAQGAIIQQLMGYGPAFENAAQCSTVPGDSDTQQRYYIKLASAVSSLTATTRELIEMDLAEADQAVGLYQEYAESRTKEWKGPIDLVAGGSRSSALNRLIGLPTSFWEMVGNGGGLAERPTNLTLLEPCTVDTSRPDVQAALTMRKRFDYGVGYNSTKLPTEEDNPKLVTVVNEVLSREGVKELKTTAGGGVEAVIKQYNPGDAAKIIVDFGSNPRAFEQAGLYLEQEREVLYRDPVPLTSATTAVPRDSVLPTPMSYGTLQQRRLKTRASSEFGFADAGLYYRLGQIREKLKELDEPTVGGDSLAATRKEIDSLIGTVSVDWQASFDVNHVVCPLHQDGTPARYLLVFVNFDNTVDVPDAITNHLWMFYGERNAACASFGKHGAENPCTPTTEAGDVMGGRFLRYYTSQSAWYGMCDPPDYPFIYWQTAPLPNPRGVPFDAADLKQITLDHPTHTLSQRSPIGGSLVELGLRISERSPKNCGESRFNSLGLPRDLVPPLENELIDTGKPYENSFNYYLNLAEQAARDAFNLAEEARKVETEIKMGERTLPDTINNLHADANDQMGQICGAAADPKVGCHATMVKLPFSNFNMLPEGACTGGMPTQPQSSSPNPEDTATFVEGVATFVNGQASCIFAKLRAVEVTVPAEFAFDGEMTAQEQARYGGEYLVVSDPTSAPRPTVS
ncbi:MAG TPA: hypothetical protein VGQ83_16650 [Polyangia bacterium]|jgi:hypothetical protein